MGKLKTAEKKYRKSNKLEESDISVFGMLEE